MDKTAYRVFIKEPTRQFECFINNATAILEKMYREPTALLFKIVPRTRQSECFL